VESELRRGCALAHPSHLLPEAAGPPAPDLCSPSRSTPGITSPGEVPLLPQPPRWPRSRPPGAGTPLAVLGRTAAEAAGPALGAVGSWMLRLALPRTTCSLQPPFEHHDPERHGHHVVLPLCVTCGAAREVRCWSRGAPDWAAACCPAACAAAACGGCCSHLRGHATGERGKGGGERGGWGGGKKRGLSTCTVPGSKDAEEVTWEIPGIPSGHGRK